MPTMAEVQSSLAFGVWCRVRTRVVPSLKDTRGRAQKLAFVTVSHVSSYTLQSRRRSKPRRLTKRHASQKEAIATARELVRNLGGTFVEQLGIDLAEGSPEAIDKWFMWALLFNHRISANIVFKTHQVRAQER